MTTVKMTISELKEHIANELREGVNFWDQHYHYDPRTDKVADLVKGALKWYSFAKSHLQARSPADPKFVNKLIARMKFLGIQDENVIEKVVFELRKIAAQESKK